MKSIKNKIRVNHKEIYNNEYTNTKSSIDKIQKKYRWYPKRSIKSSIESYKNKIII